MRGPVSFNWDIHWECNYRCPYCWFNGKWDEIKSRNRYPPYAELIKAWKNIHKLYGPVKVAITGGEPLMYPQFAEFISEMSEFHEFMIVTNLSADVSGFISANSSGNVKVNPSFHPLSAEPEQFIAKALMLKEAGMMQCVTYLAWPPLIKKLPQYQEIFTKHGLSLTVQSFFGEYEGKRYPDSYTEQEKQAVFPQLGTRGGELFQTAVFEPAGRLCNAGKTYGVIHPDGTVRRCGGINSKDAAVGNIFSDDFRLLDDPAPCASEVCPCNEWALLLEEKP